MKNVFALLLLVVFISAAFSCRKKGEVSAQAQLEASLMQDTTLIEFVDSVTYNFDTINEGDKVKHTFRIKNAGNKNLVIADAQGSCGCTVPDYPKKPIKPGETADIHVTFNSEGKPNAQNKTVTLVCNTPARREVLYITGFVIPKK